MKKNGLYFSKPQKDSENRETGEKSNRRKGVSTALVFVILTLLAVFVYVFVRVNGREYLTVWLLALAIVATCIEVYWSNPDKKSFVLWRKLFNKSQV